MDIFLIRAGSTEWDDCRRFQGRLQVPLSDQGVAQVQRGVLISGLEGIREIHSGFTLSALQTALIASAILIRPIRKNPDLDEVSFGLWEGLLESDLKRRHRRLVSLWRQSPLSVSPPQGEPLAEAWGRILEAVKGIASAKGGPHVVVLPRMAHRLAECWIAYGSPDRFFESDDRGFACSKHAL